MGAATCQIKSSPCLSSLCSCWDGREFPTFHITVVTYLSVPFTVSLCVCVCFTIAAPHPVDLSVCASGLSTLELIHRKNKPVRFVTLSWQSVWHRARSDKDVTDDTLSTFVCFCFSSHFVHHFTFPGVFFFLVASDILDNSFERNNKKAE